MMPTVSTAMRFLLFLAAFTLEVRVRAETHAAKHEQAHESPIRADKSPAPSLTSISSVLEQPDQCWKAEGPCALRTSQQGRADLQIGQSEMVLDEKTTILRVDKSDLRFVSGRLWIKAKASLKVLTEFGEIEVGPGEAWLERDSEKVLVSSAGSEIKILPRGSRAEILIEPGLENWIGKVGLNGEARIGLPSPIPLKSHLQRWAKLFRGSKAEFESQAQAFHEVWQRAAQGVAVVHQELYERKVAGLQAEEARRNGEKRRAEARNRELRDMFRKRVFGEE